MSHPRTTTSTTTATTTSSLFINAPHISNERFKEKLYEALRQDKRSLIWVIPNDICPITESHYNQSQQTALRTLIPILIDGIDDTFLPNLSEAHRSVLTTLEKYQAALNGQPYARSPDTERNSTCCDTADCYCCSCYPSTDAATPLISSAQSANPATCDGCGEVCCCCLSTCAFSTAASAFLS